jgi:hypothetical protein
MSSCCSGVSIQSRAAPPYALPDRIRFVALPHYERATALGPKLRGLRVAAHAFAAELETLDLAWLFGPHPVALACGGRGACAARTGRPASVKTSELHRASPAEPALAVAGSGCTPPGSHLPHARTSHSHLFFLLMGAGCASQGTTTSAAPGNEMLPMGIRRASATRIKTAIPAATWTRNS